MSVRGTARSPASRPHRGSELAVVAVPLRTEVPFGLVGAYSQGREPGLHSAPPALVDPVLPLTLTLYLTASSSKAVPHVGSEA